MAEVNVLREGDLKVLDDESIYAPGTVTLIRYESSVPEKDIYVLVDAGGLEDNVDDLDNWLSSIYDGVTHEDIHDVILTHNHVDHTGLVRFIGGESGATIYGSDSTYNNRNVSYSERAPNGIFDMHRFGNAIFLLDTPGHESSLDRSVLVSTNEGKVAIVGDLMLNQTEYKNPKNTDLWGPDDKSALIESRYKIIKNYMIHKVIPGHGPAFDPTDFIEIIKT